MKSLSLINTSLRLLLAAVFVIIPASLESAASPQSAPNIDVKASLSANKAQRGRSVQGSVTMDIPSGYHVNSSRPLERFLIPTQLNVEAPKGFRVGPVIYPRAVMRNFKFSKNKVSVYEGRATMRFNVTVPRNAQTGSTELNLRLRFQSCNDEVCFPPQTRELKVWLNVE
jgi:DsbC/DsbD-like thiol-disulfide interchange protein